MNRQQLVIGAVGLAVIAGLVIAALALKPDYQKQKQALIAQLPKVTNLYSIDYIKATDSFTVEILQAPAEASKQAANNYLQTRGLDLNREKIVYSVIPAAGGQPGP